MSTLPDSIATYDDPVYDGWIRTVDGCRRWHNATGALVMRHKRGYWEVWSGPMDGATYLSVGLAVHAVETGRLA